MTGTQYALNQTSDNEDLPGIVQLPAYAKYDGRLLVILGSSGKRISLHRLTRAHSPLSCAMNK